MKIHRKIALLLAIMLVMSVVLTGCANADGSKLVFGEWKIVQAPTCTNVGKETRVCYNDNTVTQTRYVPALGHEYGEFEVITPPTATEFGLQRQVCKHDSSHYIDELIPKLTEGGDVDPDQPYEVPEPPLIPADQEGVFVLGGYSKYITEDRVYALIKDFENYCNENAISRKFIGWRMYDATLDVAMLSAQIRTDNDVDFLVGVGNNITSPGNLDGGYVKEKSTAGVTIYFDGGTTDASRRHARLTDDAVAIAFFQYAHSDRAAEILTPEVAPRVRPLTTLPTIPADQEGVFVLGAYTKYISEEKTYSIVADFEKYCNENAISRKFIGWRAYDDELVVDLSAKIRSDNDVDVLTAVGNNINSSGNLDGGYVKEKSGAVTIYNDGSTTDASRRHARLSDDPLAIAFWTYIATDRAKAILELNCEHSFSDGFCLLCGALNSQKNINILLVGNSYTYYNEDLLKHTLVKLSSESRYTATIDQISYGAAILGYYLDGQYTTEFNAMLDAKSYDYIIVQDKSTRPMTDKAAFLSDVTDLKILLTTKQASAKLVMYMTWARHPSDSIYKPDGLTPEKMENSLYEAYAEASVTNQALLAPVGRAFGLLRSNSAINLYNADLTHPSIHGSYLAALVMYGVIFGGNPNNTLYIPTGISSSHAVMLREAARTAVKAG